MISWRIGEIPFVYCAQKEPGNAGFPEFLPFTLGFDVKSGIFVQCHDAAVEAVLDKAYRCGSMLSGLMDEGGIGQRYAEDFLSFICEMTPSVRGTKILDVGCGTGYLLSRLHAMGGDVLGLEPGAHGEEGAVRHRIPIIRDWFPSDRVTSKFDVISAFCLVEHVCNPEALLYKMKEQLKVNGWLILGVPDCEPYLASGDISFLFHEHWNYFTRRSITNLIQRVFGQNPIVRRSGFGGCIYAAVQMRNDMAADIEDSLEESGGEDEFAEFEALAKEGINRFWAEVKEGWEAGETIGIYVPWRAMNILALRPGSIPSGPMRFFDDNPLLHGTYYPGFRIPVESRAQLLARPPDRLLILSNTFSSEIEKQVRSEHLSIPICTWNQLYGTGGSAEVRAGGGGGE